MKDWKIAGVILSIGLLVLAFWKVDFSNLLRDMANARLWPVAAAIVLNFLVVAMKSYKWRMVLSSIKKVRYSSAFLTTLVGFMANNLLPARAGELIRIYVMGKREEVSKTSVLGTLALDRVFDGVGMLALLVSLPFLLPVPDEWRKGTLYFVGLMSIVFIFILVLLKFENDNWVTYITSNEKWINTLKTTFAKLRDGLKTLNNIKMTAGVLIISIAIWVLQAIMVYLCLKSVGLELGMKNAIFILMAINLAIIIPSAPGNFGTFELSAVAALIYLQVDHTKAMSFALIYHFMQFIPITLAGILVLPALNMRLRDLGGKQNVNDD